MAIFFMTGGLYKFILEGVGRKMCVLTNKKTLKEGKGCAEIVKWASSANYHFRTLCGAPTQ